jgi:type IV pilus assembly protein PilQ
MVDGTIIRIAPLTVLADEEAQRQKLADAQALSGELRPFTKTLSYAKAEDLQALLTKSVLSPRGSVQVDPRTNTLIITDLPDRVANASDLIATLDRAQPQVEIEARIVQVNKNFQRTLGVQWGFAGAASAALGNTTNLAFPNSGTLSGATGSTTGAVPTAVGLAVQGATSAIGLQLGSVNGAFNLDVALSALETTGNGRVLSTPRVSTQNNVEAEIKQGTQIPIQTVANNTVTVQFKDAALILKVTPQITASGTVIMKIALENGQADFTKAVNGIPPINTQSANTSVQVNDGQTTVIGGIYLSTEQYQTDRTPGLGRIPLLNWLFKRDNALDNSSELLIFITPRIIK